MGRDPQEGELVRAQAKARADLGLDLAQQEAVDQPVTRPTHAGGAVDELGDEGAVAVR